MKNQNPEINIHVHLSFSIHINSQPCAQCVNKAEHHQSLSELSFYVRESVSQAVSSGIESAKESISCNQSTPSDCRQKLTDMILEAGRDGIVKIGDTSPNFQVPKAV